jgi:thiol-disulfide isomerase/thioredoxin
MPVNIYIIRGGPNKEEEEDIGEDDKDDDDETKIQNVNDHIDKGHHAYIFVFMDGCGPCDSTKPNWRKFAKDYKSENANTEKNIMIVRINKDLFGNLKGAGGEPGGFPTLRHISNKNSSEYEKQMGDKADRSSESFNNWVNGQSGGKRRKSKKRKRKTKKTKKNKKKKTLIMQLPSAFPGGKKLM